MSEATLEQKYAKMQEILRSLERVAVAFSAGVDSTLLLKVAVDVLGTDNVVAVTGQSESLARAEYEEAVALAKSIGARHEVMITEESKDPNYLSNPANRCYFCKHELFNKLDDYIARHGYRAVVAGVNADDYADWRPGIQAGREHRVSAPCAEAGLTKADIRELSRQLGLPTHDKPASPCLASRIRYGETITAEKLQRIENAEAFLRSLGFRELRVRHHDNLARIELPQADIARACEPATRARIESKLRELGYAYVTVDLRGFRSGSMNEILPILNNTIS